MVSCQLDTAQIHLGRGYLIWGIAHVRFAYDLICLKDQLMTHVKEPWSWLVLIVDSMQPRVTREEGFAWVRLSSGLACERLMIGVEGNQSTEGGTAPRQVVLGFQRNRWASSRKKEPIEAFIYYFFFRCCLNYCPDFPQCWSITWN